MAYKKPIPYVKVGDVVLTNTGQEVEFQEREIDGEANPEFVKRRNASSRVWLKSGQRVRVLFEIDGVVDTVNPAAIGTASCGGTEVQAFYVRVRQEPAQASAPSNPSLEEGP